MKFIKAQDGTCYSNDWLVRALIGGIGSVVDLATGLTQAEAESLHAEIVDAVGFVGVS